MKNRICFLALIALSLAVAFGCGEAKTTTASTPENTEFDKVSERTNKPNGEQPNSGGTVINDPADAQPGGSYQIKPANPDDPRFKPDPRLAGGN